MKKYIVNKETGEIHNKENLTKMCNVKVENHLHTHWLGAMWRIWFCGYNGCHWCITKYDRG